MHYKTVQRLLLLEYLKSNSEHAFTIDELSARMKDDSLLEAAPGKSTIYRIMPDLVQEGLVKRFAKENSRQFLYQMICGETCDKHIHLKCSSCGKIFHVEDQQSKEIVQHVLNKHHFILSEQKTVLFGCCENCK